VFTPAAEKEASEEAKAFSEKRLLNKDVFVTLQKTDDHGNILGKISHPDGEIAYALAEAGLAKVSMPKADEEYDAEFYKTLREAQAMAQIKKLGLWKNLTGENKSKNQTYDKNAKEFTAKVLEVHSGDSVTILQEGTDKERKVFFASVKAPNIGGQQAEPEPWAWEA